MEIQHKHTANSGVFFIQDEQQKETLAKIEYAIHNPNKIIIEHTEVSDKLAGKGVGKKLVEAVVQYARAQQQKVAATCTYAHAVLLKTTDYTDVFIA